MVGGDDRVMFGVTVGVMVVTTGWGDDRVMVVTGR